MSQQNPDVLPHAAAGSVGLIEPQVHHFDTPLELECGRTLPVSYTHLTLPTKA